MVVWSSVNCIMQECVLLLNYFKENLFALLIVKNMVLVDCL